MLTKKSAKIVIAIVLSAALLAAATVSFIIFSVPKDNADAAISAASSFNYLSNGAKYFYSNSNGSVNSVTVNSSAAKGSQSNPHVIHSSNQWIFFSNLINANNSSFNSSSVFFFIDNDLDFAGNSLNPVGISASGFKATLFGGKHSFKNARFNAVNDTANSAISVSGLFYFLNEAKIYDLSIASSCVYSYASNRTTIAGTIAGYADHTNLINCSSFANITVNNGGQSSGNLTIRIGGLVGQSNYPINFYLCTYKGTITETAFNSSITSCTDNNTQLGGLVGLIQKNVIFDKCFVDANIVAHGGGLNIGGVFGFLNANLTIKMTNNMVKLKASADGITNSPDIWSIGYGWTAAAGSTLSNTYIVSSHGGAFPGATFTSSSNIVTNFAMTNATNTGSEKGVYDKAMTNSNLTSFLDFLPDGTPVPKFAPFFPLFSVGAIYLAGL